MLEKKALPKWGRDELYEHATEVEEALATSESLCAELEEQVEILKDRLADAAALLRECEETAPEAVGEEIRTWLRAD